MFTINAEARKDQGKGASAIACSNKLFIVYGGKEAAVSIELDHGSVKNMEAKPEFTAKQ